jgi:16S rRNA (guanine527-N7)-methyltransferase
LIYDGPVEQAIIAGLLRPYADLRPELLEIISIYIDLLLKWNSKINLTAVRDPQEIVTRHFGESFFAASHLVNPGWTGTAIDVGSGAGFPGLPLAMYAPGAAVTLIESHGKKAAFLNEVIFALQLRNAKVFRGRAEDFSDVADVVTLRAVERFEYAVAVAAKLVKPGGRLALMIGSSQVPTARELAELVSWDPPVAVPGGTSRVLLVGTHAG